MAARVLHASDGSNWLKDDRLILAAMLFIASTVDESKMGFNAAEFLAGIGLLQLLIV